jgi:hypothetical protein
VKTATLIAAAMLLVGCSKPNPAPSEPKASTVPPSAKTQSPPPSQTPTKTSATPSTGRPTNTPPREKPILQVESVEVSVKHADGEPTMSVEFDLVNIGNVPAKQAVVIIKVEDLRGNAEEISGEGYSCQLFGLAPGKRSHQSFPIPRWLNGLSGADRAEVVMLNTE